MRGSDANIVASSVERAHGDNRFPNCLKRAPVAYYAHRLIQLGKRIAEMASKSKTKALSRLSREQFSFDEFTEFMAQVNGEKNDRGACILLAINVETALDV